MPQGLERRQQTKEDLHFLTFSCYHRQPFLSNPLAADRFEVALEWARRRYGFYIVAYVVMPEHVHLLISEPERGTIASVVQAIKQSVGRTIAAGRHHFWQERYYDFNLWTRKKRIEKTQYIHRNPVHRGLVENPEDWPWSSFRDYATGEERGVEVESYWTGQKRERAGIRFKVKIIEPTTFGGNKP